MAKTEVKDSHETKDEPKAEKERPVPANKAPEHNHPDGPDRYEGKPPPVGQEKELIECVEEALGKARSRYDDSQNDNDKVVLHNLENALSYLKGESKVV